MILSTLFDRNPRIYWKIILLVFNVSDELPKYRRKYLKKVEDALLELGVNNDYITEEADVYYAEPSKDLEVVPDVVPEVVSKVAPKVVKKEETSANPFEGVPSESEEENPFDKFF